MADQSEELLTYLRELVTKTEAQQIPWQKVNPTTYSAAIHSANAKMVLQIVTKAGAATIRRQIVGGMVRNVPAQSPTSTTYVFQLIEGASGTPVIALNVERESPLFEVLGQLFDALKAVETKKGFDLLKRVLSS